MMMGVSVTISTILPGCRLLIYRESLCYNKWPLTEPYGHGQGSETMDVTGTREESRNSTETAAVVLWSL